VSPRSDRSCQRHGFSAAAQAARILRYTCLVAYLSCSSTELKKTHESHCKYCCTLPHRAARTRLFWQFRWRTRCYCRRWRVWQRWQLVRWSRFNHGRWVVEFYDGAKWRRASSGGSDSRWANCGSGWQL
jgi:hypothetical protein